MRATETRQGVRQDGALQLAEAYPQARKRAATSSGCRAFWKPPTSLSKIPIRSSHTRHWLAAGIHVHGALPVEKRFRTVSKHGVSWRFTDALQMPNLSVRPIIDSGTLGQTDNFVGLEVCKGGQQQCSRRPFGTSPEPLYLLIQGQSPDRVFQKYKLCIRKNDAPASPSPAETSFAWLCEVI